LAAIDHFDEIRPSDVRRFAEWLASQKVRSGEGEHERPTRTMTAYSIRAHLFALSNLYRRAQESELVPLAFNPVAALMDKPAIARKEARWLEVHDASLLLESARWLPSVVTAAGEAIGAAVAYPFLATFCRRSATGCRRSSTPSKS
jgi:hypothetical protein